jgi:O-antigen/teichoic acid export membrane protein
MNWMPAGRNFQNRLEFAKLFGITGITQVAIQGIGLLSGILVIRLLPLEEYALYTLSNTMLGTMVVLADSGIASGVTAQGGKVWQDRDALGEVMVTGLDLRKKFAIGSLLLAAPILIYLLLHHGAGWLMAILLVLSLIPAFMSSLTGALFTIPLKLHQSIKPLQKNLLVESLGRFVLIFSLFLLPWAFIALLASGIPRIIANLRLRKLSRRFTDWTQRPNLRIKNEILAMVRRLMPGAFYFCISGQISIWLISIFGNTDSVAQIGALGRIAILTSVVSTVFGTLFYPRFARSEQKKKLLIKRFFLILTGLTAVFSLLLFLVWIFGSQILFVFGAAYAGLEFELLLSVLSSSLGVLSGAAFALTTVRGWAINPRLSIPVSIAAIVIGAWLMNVSTLVGILVFNIFLNSVQLLLNSGYFLFSIQKINGP